MVPHPPARRRQEPAAQSVAWDVQRLLLLAGLACAAVAAAPSAALAGQPCRAAKLQSIEGAGQVLDYNFRSGVRTDQTYVPVAAKAHRKLTWGHVYELHGAAATFTAPGGNAWKAADGTIVTITCHNGKYPALRLIEGRLDVTSKASRSAGVVTTEALVGPLTLGGPKLRFRVERKPVHELDAQAAQDGVDTRLLDIFKTAAGFIDAPHGTTSVDKLGDSPNRLNVTPYVGSKEGTCRYVDSAELTSTGKTYGKVKGGAVGWHLIGRADYKLDGR